MGPLGLDRLTRRRPLPGIAHIQLIEQHFFGIIGESALGALAARLNPADIPCTGISRLGRRPASSSESALGALAARLNPADIPCTGISRLGRLAVAAGRAHEAHQYEHNQQPSHRSLAF